MKALYLWVTPEGEKIARKLAASLGGIPHRYQKELVAYAFSQKIPLVFVCACGIAVRAIAAYLTHKSKDPPVLVVDEGGNFVISLLSGHLGGANNFAKEVASCLHAIPVITTASDIRGLPALDIWLQKIGAVIEDWEKLKKLQQEFLKRKKLKVYLEPPLEVELPPQLEKSNRKDADFILGFKEAPKEAFFPLKCLCLGLGFHDQEKNLSLKVKAILKKEKFSLKSIKTLATISSRANNPFLTTLAQELEAELISFPPEKLALTSPPSPSFAKKALNIPGVAEPCALLASQGGPLLLPKTVHEGITLAVTLHRNFTFR